MQITSAEIRQKYLDFFKSKNHAILESAPLVPENDPSVLFNTAWMQPLVPYLLGEKHPMWTRLADVQKCLRTVDIDDVWDNTHCTFFEMLGNWSLWDYFKKESIEWSYELLTDSKWFWIDPNHLAVTVFEWDDQVWPDEESVQIWKSCWVPVDRISYLSAKDNFWAAGPTWPCGPCTEIYFWVWEWEPRWNVKENEDEWMEIWNNVFMEFNRAEDWKLSKLPAKNVDTGMWLERITRTLNREESVYSTDIFSDVIAKIKTLVWEDKYIEKSARIIADHLRASTHLIADWVYPKNVDQWYILRRLIRRAIREFYKMWYEGKIISEIGKMYIEKFKDVYLSVKNNQDKIIEELDKEEDKFGKTIKQWEKMLEKKFGNIIAEWSLIWWNKESWWIYWVDVFDLFQTYGFPLEMTIEIINEISKNKWISIDIEQIIIEYNLEYQKHQELSRTAAEGKFKWWLAGGGEMETKYHTATHMLLAWLRKVLGNHVFQAWSNITAERLRFDFTHGEKVTPEQLKEVEDFVNSIIINWASVELKEMKKDEAKESWIVGSFWEKYPEVVKIYTIKWNDWVVYSQELCWGPHMDVISKDNFGTFKIQKEEASSSGVRRIKAVLE